MIVLSHRGYWQHPDEKNGDLAFKRSFDLGFGTETDVRDHHGQLVISHDMPKGCELPLTGLIDRLNHRHLPLAINIKADGLVAPLTQFMKTAGVHDWFVFDMSIPDMRSYLQAGAPVFARMSEVEKNPAYFQETIGIWLDAFSSIWYTCDDVLALLKHGKRVCVVSPELHGREFSSLWQMLLPLSKETQLMICTDHPEQARKFFGES